MTYVHRKRFTRKPKDILCFSCRAHVTGKIVSSVPCYSVDFHGKRRYFSIRSSSCLLCLALKNLLQEEYLICTPRTYANVQERMSEFMRTRKDLRIATIHERDGVKKIKRVA